jgi:alcohol dehydrogenase (NADP+)
MEAGGILVPFEFSRRDAGPRDVLLEVTHCGVCHSDLHYVNNDWGYSRYPLVPGHEIVGRVVSVGEEVTKVRPGEVAAIGCIVDSCRECAACKDGEEQDCAQRPTLTYGDTERGSDRPTYGGYSANYVVDEHFALRVPDALDPAAAAPLLCAGITTYSPLRRWQVGPGTRVGVVGLGGLGHMAIKFAAAFGAEVVVLTTSPDKVEDARALGASDVVVSSDRPQMKAHRASLDFILDTVSAPHDVAAELALLRNDGTLCLVGMPDAPMSVPATALVSGRKRLAGSAIGGIEQTQEMLEFCGARGIGADVELIGVDDIEGAYARMAAGKVRYRSVIDLTSLSA